MRDRSFRRFVLRRTRDGLLLLWGVTIVTFTIATLVPGDPVAAAIGPDAAGNERVVAAFKARHGLDRPLPVQYAVYLGNVLQGDLGTSLRTGRPVLTDLREYIPATIELAVAAMAMATIVGITVGTVAASFRDTIVDQAIRVLSLAGVSMPVFWLALVAIFVVDFRLDLLPGLGRLDAGMLPPPRVTGLYTVDAAVAGDWEVLRSALGHLILPAFVMGSFMLGLITRFTRSTVLEVLTEDYVRNAEAKGLPRVVVMYRHVLRSALVPIITLVAIAFGTVLNGAVLVEQIFSWPGLGQYAYHSATNLDLPAVTAVALFVAIVFIALNFLADVLYAVIDPRIRL